MRGSQKIQRKPFSESSTDETTNSKPMYTRNDDRYKNVTSMKTDNDGFVITQWSPLSKTKKISV